MSTALVQRSVSFYGDDLAVIRQNGGDFTPVKPVCDILGIDWESQRQRIMRDDVLSSVACVIQATGADGKRYDMLCLPLDFLNGWLFGVSAGHIKPQNRENLKRYKLECYRVLSQAFSRRPAPLLKGPRLWDRIWEWAQERYQGTPAGEIALNTRDIIERFDLSPACAGKYLRLLSAQLPTDLARQRVARRGQPPLALKR